MKKWWESHPRELWTRTDWREARRLGVVPPAREPYVDPAVLLAATAAPKVAWGPTREERGDNRSRRVDEILKDKGLR